MLLLRGQIMSGGAPFELHSTDHPSFVEVRLFHPVTGAQYFTGVFHESNALSFLLNSREEAFHRSGAR